MTAMVNRLPGCSGTHWVAPRSADGCVIARSGVAAGGTPRSFCDPGGQSPPLPSGWHPKQTNVAVTNSKGALRFTLSLLGYRTDAIFRSRRGPRVTIAQKDRFALVRRVGALAYRGDGPRPSA